MTRSDLTHLYVLLDRSGSMESIASDVEGGFAAFLDEQRSTPGEARITLAKFDNLYEEVYRDLPVAAAPPLDLDPRGSTALLDSMGRLITEAGERLAALPEDERPGTVVVAIMTDGLENVSREWARPDIKRLVERKSDANGWQFLYMGADQDAVEVGVGLGVAPQNAASFARGRSLDALRMKSLKVSEMRRARLDDASASLAGFTEEERAELMDDADDRDVADGGKG